MDTTVVSTDSVNWRHDCQTGKTFSFVKFDIVQGNQTYRQIFRIGTVLYAEGL